MTKATPPVAAAIGQWQSPISARSLSQANIRLGEPSLANGCAYWLEGRPNEQGRSVLVRKDQHGVVEDLTPAPFNVRTLAHEYGGGAYAVMGDQCVFVNQADQGVYQISSGDIHRVYQCDGVRFADLLIDQKRGQVIAVAEDHRNDGEAKNYLCAINIASSELTCLHEGADFYSSPTLDGNGERLAWLTWMHPFMPWENTQLHIATLDQHGGVVKTHEFGHEESIFQPLFGPDQRLYFASDRNNWWNLYALDKSNVVTAITTQEAEFGVPQWVFGMRTFGFISDTLLVAARVTQGVWDVCQIDLDSGSQTTVQPWPYSAIEHLATGHHSFICLASSANVEESIVLTKVTPTGAINSDVLRTASETKIDHAYLSTAEAIHYTTSDNEKAHGFFYAPRNPQFTRLENETPPLLILVHGGPTTATDCGLNPRIQFWTSRGFAILDVNYRGSSGYGRDYRRKLNGQWGVKDVDDCVHGAQYLIDDGRVDAQRIFIMGGSAGGYTVLSALAFTSFFHGGVSLYGVGDLEVLMDDTHKFESRYTLSLIGDYDQQLYRSRSPLYSAQSITAPVLFFQGSEDKVVPPNQAEMMVAALKKNGVPTQYVKMEGEGHGFRRSDSIETLLDTTLDFLTRLATHGK